MANNGTNTVDERTGSVSYRGESELTKGNHKGMPKRTDAYLPTDERGHVQASSLGGSNRRDNIVPQAKDLNHGSYYNMEKAERDALKDGSRIQSEKTAFVSNQPGGRPDAFIVNDHVTYSDGKQEDIHLSFSNMQDDEQEGYNKEAMDQASDLLDEAPNPGDGLRESMTPEEYSQLMEATDQELPSIADEYTQSSPAEPDGPDDGEDGGEDDGMGLD